jgi:hypothetical protein
LQDGSSKQGGGSVGRSAAVEPAAVGPDPRDDALAEYMGHASTGDGGSSRRGRLVLAACLVALVVGAVGALLITRGGEPSDAPMVDEVPTPEAPVRIRPLSATATATATALAHDSSALVHVVLTNVIDVPVTLQGDLAGSVRLTMPGPVGLDDSQEMTYWAMYSRKFGQSLVPSDTTGPAPDLVLQPGESVAFESAIPVDDQSATGPGKLEVQPRVLSPQQSPDGSMIYATDDVLAEIPVTVARPADGHLTGPDAVRTILSDSEVQSWIDRVTALPYENRGSGPRQGGGVSALRRVGDRVRFINGAVPVSYGADSEAAVRAFGGPGLIADVTRDGVVTIQWVAPEP